MDVHIQAENGVIAGTGPVPGVETSPSDANRGGPVGALLGAPTFDAPCASGTSFGHVLRMSFGLTRGGHFELRCATSARRRQRLV